MRIARGFWTSRFGVTLLGCAVLLLIGGAGALSYYYIAYSRMIDARLSGQVFANTSIGVLLAQWVAGVQADVTAAEFAQLTNPQLTGVPAS